MFKLLNHVEPDWSRISRVASNSHIVYSGNSTFKYNMHPYIEFFDGKLFVLWTTHYSIDENFPGSMVRYVATDSIGDFTGADFVTPRDGTPSGRQYAARDFWVKDGVLYALAGLWRSEGANFPDLVLRAYAWEGTGWSSSPAFEIDNSLNNYAPIPLDGGGWVFPRRDADNNITLRFGDVGSWSDAPVTLPSEGIAFTEPTLKRTASGDFVLLLRSSNNRIWRGTYGPTLAELTPPYETNFHDANCKHSVCDLDDGTPLIVSNPGSDRKRLTMGVGNAADEYTLRLMLDNPPTAKFRSAKSVGIGYQYPSRIIERDGKIYVANSRNKEDVMISEIDIGDL